MAAVHRFVDEKAAIVSTRPPMTAVIKCFANSTFTFRLGTLMAAVHRLVGEKAAIVSTHGHQKVS